MSKRKLITYSSRDKYAPFSDAEIIRLYQTGDSIAFEALVHRYQSKMTRYIASITSDELAPDAMQDTWVAVITSIHDGSYKEDQCFSKWIKGIAYRQAVKAWNEEHKISFSDVRLPETTDRSFNEEQRIINKESEKLLHDSLDRLGERERQVVILHAWGERSFYEIAVVMHINASTARSMYVRAVKKMKNSIG